MQEIAESSKQYTSATPMTQTRNMMQAVSDWRQLISASGYPIRVLTSIEIAGTPRQGCPPAAAAAQAPAPLALPPPPPRRRARAAGAAPGPHTHRPPPAARHARPAPPPAPPPPPPTLSAACTVDRRWAMTSTVPPGRGSVQRLLHQVLVLSIQCRRGFVQQQHPAGGGTGQTPGGAAQGSRSAGEGREGAQHTSVWEHSAGAC